MFEFCIRFQIITFIQSCSMHFDGDCDLGLESGRSCFNQPRSALLVCLQVYFDPY